MNICSNLCFHFGGLGEAYAESRGTKLSRRHHHTGYIYVQQGKTMVTMAGDKQFDMYVKILTSLAIWGPGGGGGGA